MDDQPPRRSARRALLGLLVLVLVLAVVGTTIVLVTGHRRAAAPHPGAVHVQTTPVATRTLTDALTVSGTVRFTGITRLVGRGVGTITELPRAGGAATRGSVLYRVDDQPVIVFYGRTPFFRTISRASTPGADIAVLASNLKALGYFGGLITADPHDMRFSSLLAEALKDWQHATGMTVTGTFAVGQAVVLPHSERVSAVSADLGDPAAEPVATLSSTHRVVSAGLQTDQAREIRRGARATIDLPSGSSVQGVATVATTPSDSPYAGGSSPSPFELTISSAKQADLAAAGTRTVQITIVIQQQSDVLTVPIAALLALKGGSSFALQLPSGRLIGVHTGMFTSEYVEVRGTGLSAGMSVVTAS